MNLDELFASMGHDEPRQCPLKGEDAIAALREGFKNYTTVHRFEPGDLIIQKDGCNAMTYAGERADNPVIFIRYEDGLAALFDRPPAGGGYNHATPDCVIGKLHTDGGMIVLATHSASFEPYVAPAVEATVEATAAEVALTR